MPDHCIICHSKQAKAVFIDHEIPVLRCSHCSHVYSSYNAEQYYQGYFGDTKYNADVYWWRDAHRKMYHEFGKRYLSSRGGRLLDVGCGLGFFIDYVSRIPGWQTTGYEISPGAVSFAKETLGLKTVYCGKVEDSKLPDNHFDIITLWDVIEHLPDPGPILNFSRKALKNGGFLFIHTPNINIQLPKARIKSILSKNRGGHYLEAKDHINIYSPVTIRLLLKQYGFERVDLVQLPPIQSVSGNRSRMPVWLKNVWFYSAKIVFVLTGIKLI